MKSAWSLISALGLFTAFVVLVWVRHLIVVNWRGGFVETFREIRGSVLRDRIVWMVLGLMLLAYLMLAVVNNQ